MKKIIIVNIILFVVFFVYKVTPDNMFSYSLENNSNQVIEDITIIVHQNSHDFNIVTHKNLFPKEKINFYKMFSENNTINYNVDSSISIKYKVNNSKEEKKNELLYSDNLNFSSFEIYFEENGDILNTKLKIKYFLNNLEKIIDETPLF